MEMPRSRTLPDLLDEMAARHPDREAVVGGTARLTYAEYRTRVRQLAKGLHRLGVRRGDKVALLMDCPLIDALYRDAAPDWKGPELAREPRGHGRRSRTVGSGKSGRCRGW